jgi:hypothetical protein
LLALACPAKPPRVESPCSPCQRMTTQRSELLCKSSLSGVAKSVGAVCLAPFLPSGQRRHRRSASAGKPTSFSSPSHRQKNTLSWHENRAYRPRPDDQSACGGPWLRTGNRRWQLYLVLLRSFNEEDDPYIIYQSRKSYKTE